MSKDIVPFLFVAVIFGGMVVFNGWFGASYKQEETESFYQQVDPDRYEFYNNQIIPPSN